MGEIERYFSKNIFDNFKEDITKGINPLVDTIKKSGGELDLQFRPDNKFNIYYKGNSLAEVKIQINKYVVKIHEKFEPIAAADKDEKKRFPEDRFLPTDKYYLKIEIEREELLKFFQQSIIKSLSNKIKKVNNGEEIAFEQILMTDNIGREDFIIIDRQVKGGGGKGIIDLIALKKIHRGKYKFVVLEVKLGNNEDLKGKVVNQIETYMKSIENNIESFKRCYENNYAQKKDIGLFPESFSDTITIDNNVEGNIVVGMYSKIGEQYIEKLTENFPKWNKDKNIIQFINKLEIK